MSKTTMFSLRHWKTQKEGNKVPVPVKLSSGEGRQIISKESNKYIIWWGQSWAE